MTLSQRSVEGTILRLQCNACGSTFPHFVFSGKGDSDTAGLCSASSCRSDEVAIVEAEPSEWNALANAQTASIESRLRESLPSNDLKCIRLLRVEHDVTFAQLSFAEFRKVYKPTVPIYSCICCGIGESRAVKQMTVNDFEESGGRILLTSWP